MAHKLTGKHGDRAPELKKVENLLDALHAEMFAHLQKEEQVLFPFIAQMEEETVGFASSAHACFQTVAQPVSMMVREHESAEGLVSRVAQTDERIQDSGMGMPHVHRALCRPWSV